MEGMSRLHRVIFSSGNNPRSTIEFVENRGVNLFEDFGGDRKQFNPVKMADSETDNDGKPVPIGMIESPIPKDGFVGRHDPIDFNLPVLVGGRNASGKTSLLRAIEIVCYLLQEEEEGWGWRHLGKGNKTRKAIEKSLIDDAKKLGSKTLEDIVISMIEETKSTA